MKISLFVSIILSLILLSACGATQPNLSNTTSNQAKTAQTPALPKDNKPKFNPAETVKFSPPAIELKSGGASEAELKITILPPYHVNSNPPSEKNFIPLEISFENAEGITVGKPVYPKGEMKKFAFNPDEPLSVYEGETVVKLPLKADKSAAAGQRILRGKLGFQPCDDEVCYPPQKIDVTLPVTIN